MCDVAFEEINAKQCCAGIILSLVKLSQNFHVHRIEILTNLADKKQYLHYIAHSRRGVWSYPEMAYYILPNGHFYLEEKLHA